jgi:short subunit dehydrogenase-like uncharacterized protein
MTDKLDVIVYGATGFTGRLVVDYLAAHAPKGVRWGIAGRRRDKLAEIAELVRAGGGPRVETFVASSDDPRSLEEVARCTKVVLTTVGPYALVGEPVVAACVSQGADYVDITGEPHFVDRLLVKYDKPAREKGLRLVSCCGFDSIPHDLGALFTVERMDEGAPIDLEGFVQGSGTISGGTWHSAVNAFSDRAAMKQAREDARRPSFGRVGRLEPRIRREKRVGGWVVPMPTIDPAVVLRSAAELDVYGPRFRYAHYMRIKSLAGVVGVGALVGATVALAQLEPTKALLLKWKASGDGPDALERERGHFKVTFVGESRGRTIVTTVSGGDPGYGETSKMVSEAALCLALDRDALPDRAGVLTTAVAMGDLLVRRLSARGIRFDVVSSDFPTRAAPSPERDAAHA